MAKHSDEPEAAPAGELVSALDEHLRALASTLASSVAGELARPLHELRENLGAMVETIDEYMRAAPGPAPYPWKSLHALRQELADAYLRSREVARLAFELHDSVSGVGGELGVVDVNRCVESALHLARHRIGARTEVFVDLGSAPPVRAVAGELVLAIAKLIFCCAESAAARDASAISIRTFCEQRRADGAVVITVSDNGAGLRAAVDAAAAFVAPVMRALGGGFSGVSEAGQGSAFECRLPVSAQDASERVAPAVPER
ncbi:HAMP domain-containing histidine kinase [Haliangium ochraceum]|uniref:Histidine kinase n=1 Tax=Haliangium ochraceum (strain DSM 14365 / JCM 11303 / SMP-2) TaxID=502025 RepID=D0LG77_HALO1|nr:HAMP domain-containing histidine kinase [Haliangium ochraceum]ACY18102.1 hypothetical protein Hoch_5622 [Haliangium ochraceum DSM 14365]